MIVSIALLALLAPSLAHRATGPWRRLSLHVTTDVDDVSIHGNLRIACFNIAHGRGTAKSNWGGGGEAQRVERLNQIGKALAEMNADIVILNEVDFDSSWSHSINQAAFLAEKAGYRYRVEQRNVDARLLGWKWGFGNAVLSRLPIENAEMISFPGYSWWEAMCFGKKRGMVCDMRVGDRNVRVVAAHLCHRSENVRVRSAAVICDLARRSQHETIVAGDMNSTPPGFPRSNRDVGGRNAIATYDDSGLFRRQPDHEFHPDDFTFPSDQPDRLIDWILIPSDWEFIIYEALPTELSDHRAVVASITPRRSP